MLLPGKETQLLRVSDNKIFAGNPAKEIKSLDLSKKIRSREKLFETNNYDDLMKYLIKQDLRDNSFSGWLRTIIFPKKGD